MTTIHLKVRRWRLRRFLKIYQGLRSCRFPFFFCVRHAWGSSACIDIEAITEHSAFSGVFVPTDRCTKWECNRVLLRFGMRFYNSPAVWFCPRCGVSYGASAKHAR